MFGGEVRAVGHETTNEARFESEQDEKTNEKSEIVSCKISLIHIQKVAFTSCGHCACFSCADKLQDCHICRKNISKKIKICFWLTVGGKAQSKVKQT